MIFDSPRLKNGSGDSNYVDAHEKMLDGSFLVRRILNRAHYDIVVYVKNSDDRVNYVSVCDSLDDVDRVRLRNYANNRAVIIRDLRESTDQRPLSGE